MRRATSWNFVSLVLIAAIGSVCSPVHGQDGPPTEAKIEAKMRRFQELLPKWLDGGGNPAEMAPLGQQLNEHLGARDLRKADEVLDRMLAIVSARNQGSHAIRPSQVRVKLYDSTGRPVPKAELAPRAVELAVTGVYPLDINYDPIPSGVATVEDGVVTLAEPVPSPIVVHFFPRIEGFGQVKVYADNGGKGYTVPPSGALDLDLPLEAARSRVAKTRELTKGRDTAVFRQETLARLASAEQHLTASLRNGRIHPAAVYRSLRDALWAGEMATVDVARDAIAKRGRRDGFRFGIFTEGHERWGAAQRDQVRAVFNFGTVLSFFLRDYEDNRGNPRPEAAERAVALLEKLRMEPKGHPLIYLIPPNMPPRLQGKASEVLVEAMRTRVVREVQRFRGRIRVWDVVNEPNFCGCPYREEQTIDLARMAMKWMRDTDPAAVRVVNAGMPTGDFVVAPGVREMAVRAANGTVHTTRQYFQALLRAGVEYDVTGIELYYPSLDMMELSRLLDRYAQLGKPIHVTELGVASAPGVDRKSQHFQNPEFIAALGEWHQPWSETVQADWIEHFYTIAYSKASVEAITWTHLVDFFWPFGGLLRRDLTPKESYWRLRELLNSWGFPGADKAKS